MVIVAGCIVGLILIVCAQNVCYRRKTNVLGNIIANRDMDIAILKNTLDRSEQDLKVCSEDLEYYKSRYGKIEKRITEIKELLGNA